MKNNKFIRLIKPLVTSCVIASSLMVMNVGHAAPAEKLDLTLSTYSQNKIKKLLNDPKVWDQIPKQVTLCVYSPSGEHGEAFEQATSYLTEIPRIVRIAKQYGVNMNVTRPSNLQMNLSFDYPKLKKTASTLVTLKVYTNESVLTEDFRSKRCDGAGISNLRAKQFNKFVGRANPKFDEKMVNKDFEVVGVVPLGGAYIMVGDRNINTLAKAAGKKIAVLQFDETQKKLVQNVGAQPVAVDLLTVGPKFNNKEVDIMAAPAILFEPMELHRGMTDKSGKVVGGIIKFPVIQVTGTLIMHRNKFPAGMGSIAREIISKQLTPAFNFVDKLEGRIPDKYWMTLNESDKPGYVRLMREARIQMTKEGYYDPDMMKLLKQIRCSQDPTNYECALKDE